MIKNDVPPEDDDQGLIAEEMEAIGDKYAADAEEEEDGDNSQEQTASGAGLEPDYCDEEDKPPQFPLEALPPLFRETVETVINLYQVDAVLPVMCLLGIHAASFGAGLQAQSNKAMTRGNLYLLAGAESGTGKSLVQKELQHPLDVCETAYMETHKAQQQQDVAAKKIATSRIQRLLRDSSKKTLSEDIAQKELVDLVAREEELENKINGTPRLSTIDFTSEAMGVLLKGSGEQMAVLTAEGGTVLYNILGRYTKGDATDDILLCKSYSGDRHVVDRIGRPPVRLKSPCVTLQMSVQPDLLYKAYEHERLWVGGFLARCLAADTKIEPQYEDENTVYSIDPNRLTKWETHIRSAVEAFRFVATPYTIPVELDVYKLSSAYRNIHVDQVRGDLHDVRNFVHRWREQAWRIAINLHLGLHGVDCIKHQLSADTFKKAIVITLFFSQELLKILQRQRAARTEKELAKILELLMLGDGEWLSFRMLETNHGFTAADLKKLAIKYPKRLAIFQTKPAKGSVGGRPRLWIGQPRAGTGENFRGLRT